MLLRKPTTTFFSTWCYTRYCSDLPVVDNWLRRPLDFWLLHPWRILWPEQWPSCQHPRTQLSKTFSRCSCCCCYKEDQCPLFCKNQLCGTLAAETTLYWDTTFLFFSRRDEVKSRFFGILTVPPFFLMFRTGDLRSFCWKGRKMSLADGTLPEGGGGRKNGKERRLLLTVLRAAGKEGKKGES